MGYKFLILALCICAMATLTVMGCPALWIVIAAVCSLVAAAYCYYSVMRPARVMLIGLDLLKAQDFGSKLCPTGWSEADVVVDVFNRMIDSLKHERLKSQEQNQFLTQLIEVSPTGIAISDFDGNIIETNPAYRRLDSEELHRLISNLQIGQTQTLRLSNARIYRCSRLYFIDNGFRRPFIIVEQLTDEIAAAERQMFKTIVRTIGHEVNNSLGSVMSVLETLEEGYTQHSPEAEALSASRRSCAELVNFIRGYAEVVKLPPVQPAPTILANEIAMLMPTLQGLTAQTTQVNFQVTGQAATLLLDMTLLSRAIINIVKNAGESIGNDPDGRVEIVLDGHKLTITDNGRGVAPENLGRLFTPFFSTKHPDRGLGLMLIADILRAHGATFSLVTDPATRLTTFTINFR